MGVAVSNWKLAQAVARLGQLGVISGTGLTQVLARRLQDGDLEGDVRRALAHFPFQQMAHNIIEMLYIPGGKKPDQPYKPAETVSVKSNRWADELCIAANFVEVFLAREGHSNPVGINYLEKIQIPHLPSAYGAMLAGAAVVIMGAGIPAGIPQALDALSKHCAATYNIHVHGALPATDCQRVFDPAIYIEAGYDAQPLNRPDFLPIISSDLLATMLLRMTAGSTIQGFVIEGPTAGGHNAPPRGALALTEDGQPIYGKRDMVNLENVAKLGLPFWLAGGYGSPEGYQIAISKGAAGVQVGTPFALCTDSGLPAEIRRGLLEKALAGEAHVYTDRLASPTGYPFKVASLNGTLSEKDVYEGRQRICNLGYLRDPYVRDDGTIGYRCAAEPVAAYVAKGGKIEDTVGRKCICNALLATASYAQLQPNGSLEPGIVTTGDDLLNIGRFCSPGHLDYSAEDVVRKILG